MKIITQDNQEYEMESFDAIYLDSKGEKHFLLGMYGIHENHNPIVTLAESNYFEEVKEKLSVLNTSKALQLSCVNFSATE